MAIPQDRYYIIAINDFISNFHNSIKTVDRITNSLIIIKLKEVLISKLQNVSKSKKYDLTKAINLFVDDFKLAINKRSVMTINDIISELRKYLIDYQIVFDDLFKEHLLDQQLLDDILSQQKDERNLRQIQQSKERRQLNIEFKKHLSTDVIIAGLKKQISELNQIVDNLEFQNRELKLKNRQLRIKLKEKDEQDEQVEQVEQDEQYGFEEDDDKFNNLNTQQQDERKLKQIQQSIERRNINKEFKKQMPDILIIALLKKQISELNRIISNLKLQNKELIFYNNELTLELRELLKRTKIPCTCITDTSKCKANRLSHKCTCYIDDGKDGIYGPKTCRATIFLHDCICRRYNKTCKSTKHTCICTMGSSGLYNLKEMKYFLNHFKRDSREKSSKDYFYYKETNDYGKLHYIKDIVDLCRFHLKYNQNNCRSQNHTCMCKFNNILNEIISDKHKISELDMSSIYILTDFVKNHKCRSNVHN